MNRQTFLVNGSALGAILAMVGLPVWANAGLATNA